jgi:hypothetical protein
MPEFDWDNIHKQNVDRLSDAIDRIRQAKKYLDTDHNIAVLEVQMLERMWAKPSRKGR